MSTKAVVAVQLLCASLLYLQHLCTGQTMRCRKNTVISNNATLLASSQNITAFRDNDVMYPLENIIGTAAAFWCADGTGNYVNMTFSQPVVLEGVISSGATSLSGQVQHYVSDFTILYSKTIDGPLQLYSVQNFTTNSWIHEYKFIDSLAGLRFQFRINKFLTATSFCWTLRIIGCTLDSAVLDNPVTVCSTTPAPSSTVQKINTAISIVQQISTAAGSTVQQTICPRATMVTVTIQPSCDSVGQQQSSQVAGAIGGGIAVLLVGVVMIISAIILCIITLVTRRKKQSVEVKNNRSSTVLKLENNALYTSGTINSSSYEEGTLTNTLYGDVDMAAEYATVENIQSTSNVVTSPNHCYRAMDHSNNTTYDSK